MHLTAPSHWSRSIGTGGRDPSERVVTIVGMRTYRIRTPRGLAIGRIYQTRGGPEHLRWFWSLTMNPPMARSGKVATLEEAKAQLQKS